MDLHQLIQELDSLVESTPGKRQEAHKKLAALPKVGEEHWDDGTHVVWHESPFPFRRKPSLPSKLHDTAQVRSVPLSGIHGSQTRVTARGVAKHLDAKPKGNLPLVYREHDGSHTIGDGHHRLLAAHLLGKKKVRVRVVDVPTKE